MVEFSIENLIAVAIVGQKDVILVGENNLSFRDTHGSRHTDISIDIFTTGVIYRQ